MAPSCVVGVQGALTVMLILSLVLLPVQAGNFFKAFHVTWGGDRAKILNHGKQLSLTLDQVSGSGFESKSQYLYGQFDMRLKLVPGNSAGTVTTFFLSSSGPGHDEIDFEFLGNVSGQPYTIHTNVFSQGKGDREQQFQLWFDPSADFHTYSITWNPHHIVFSVDGIPLREFKNLESLRVPYPKSKPMKIYASLWNADDWATMGGRVKTDWTRAPFVASYGDCRIRACKWVPRTKSYSCPSHPNASKTALASKDQWMVSQKLDSSSRRMMKMVQRKHMIYNYCTDKARFPQGLPPECRKS